MGLNEDDMTEWDPTRKLQEERIERWWMEMDKKRQKELKKAEQRAFRQEIWSGWKTDWDPRNWDWLVVVTWVGIGFGCGAFWVWIIRWVMGRL